MSLPAGDDERPIITSTADAPPPDPAAESLSSNQSPALSDDQTPGADDAIPQAPPRSTMEPWMLAVIVIAIAVILAVLYLINPAERSIGPPCVFHTTTGLYCPGCGGTRAAHALLHGDIRQAAAWNILALIVIPILAGYGLYALVMFVRHRHVPAPILPRRAVIIIVIIFVTYMIARNLPFEPFASLAPNNIAPVESPSNSEG